MSIEFIAEVIPRASLRYLRHVLSPSRYYEDSNCYAEYNKTWLSNVKGSVRDPIDSRYPITLLSQSPIGVICHPKYRYNEIID